MRGSACGVYPWVERTLVWHQHAGLGRTDKGECGNTSHG